MNKVIKTKSVGMGITEVTEDFILSEEPMSRLVFQAKMHSKGIRGRIVRQRRESTNDVWISEKAMHIRDLGKNETINLDLCTDAVNKLYSAIVRLANILKEKGIEYGENSYAVVDPESIVITDKNKVQYIKKIVDAGHDEDVWRQLVEANPTLVTKLSYARILDTKNSTLKELNDRLEKGGYLETSGDDSWQKWIYDNNWLFGVNYRDPIQKEKINISGIMPDYLFPTLDNFVDILEIKLPHDEVIVADSSHPGSWKFTLQTNLAIGQVVNYLGEIDRLRREIEPEVKKQYGYEVYFLKPRAYILIGDSDKWEDDKKEGLRKLNHALHGIEILTYRDLYDRGKRSLEIKNE
ncbi:MAG: Shedu anti-phage system protein SduA domain-containing protein [bacterium]